MEQGYSALVKAVGCGGRIQDYSVPVVQFSTPIYFCVEGESHAVVEVYRIGTHAQLECSSQSRFETVDDSALDGRHYKATSGLVCFEPKETTKAIRISLLGTNEWNTTTEFKCRLLADGLSGAILDQYLFETRVKIIDSNTFPTDRFKGVDLTCDHQARLALPMHFFWLNFVNNRDITKGTVKLMLMHAVHNVHYFVSLFMGVYLLDSICNPEKPSSELPFVHDHHAQLVIYILITLVLLGVLHFCDYKSISFGVVGKTKNFLETALMRKYLNYTNKARSSLDSGEIVSAVQRDVPQCIQCYLAFLRIADVIGHLFVMLLFKYMSSFVFHTPPVQLRIIMIPALYPVFLLIFFLCRSHKTENALEARSKAEDDTISAVTSTTSEGDLIMDYHLRNYANSMFTSVSVAANGKMRAFAEISTNNLYVAKWGTLVCVGFYIYFGGCQKIDGVLSTGLFVTNMQVVQAWCQSFTNLYEVFIVISTAVPHIANLTRLINLPTDVLQRMHLSRNLLAVTTDLRQRARDQMGSGDVAVDLLPIVIKFNHVNITDWAQGRSKLYFNCDFYIKQGSLVVISGPKATGKATLLRLIAGRYQPKLENGEMFFVPSHLRACNVHEYPLFFRLSLMDNLTFGLDKSSALAAKDRIWDICRMLGVKDEILAYLNLDLVEYWPSRCSGAQCRLLSIARALISNYEIICMHKPTTSLIKEDEEHVMDALSNHVQERGLCLEYDKGLRRFRTVFLSTGDHETLARHNSDTLYLAEGGAQMIKSKSTLELMDDALRESLIGSAAAGGNQATKLNDEYTEPKITDEKTQTPAFHEQSIVPASTREIVKPQWELSPPPREIVKPQWELSPPPLNYTSKPKNSSAQTWPLRQPIFYRKVS